jgi:hypothetical protein
MNTLACCITISVVAGMAGGDDAGVTYRTRGAVSARPQCGYSDELQNLLPQSARFPAGTWRAAASTPDLAPTVEANADTGPSGERHAARVTFDATSAPTPKRWSCLEAPATVIPGETYTFSFSVKGPEGAFITARGAAGAGFSRIPLNGRWQRVHLTEVATKSTPTLRIGLGAHDAGESPVPAAVTVLLWGPQLVLGRGAVPYRPSGDKLLPTWPLALVPPGAVRTACPPLDAPQPASTNLLRWTADPKRAPWVITGLTGAHAGNGPSPIGARDAHLLQESKSPGPHGLSQSFDCPRAGPFVASIFVRPGARTHAELALRLPGGDGRARFDLAGGIAMAMDGTGTARIDPIGKGWLRLQVAATASSAGPGQMFLRLLERHDGSPDYDGDGSGGLLVWGPQVEAGTEATSHIPTFFIPETREADETPARTAP